MSFMDVIQQNMGLVAYTAYFAFIIAICAWYSLKDRGKIQVRIKTAIEEQTKWVKPQKDGKTIVMQKPDKKKLGWKFTFDHSSVVFKKKWWGLSSFRAIEVFYDAQKAITFNYEDKTITQPQLTKDEIGKLNNLQAVQARYGKISGGASNLIQYAILMGVIVVAVLIFMQMRGIRI
jgi:hypothetical protein